VQLIQEAVLQYVLEKLNLPRANVLISAWWKFVILTNKVNEKALIFIQQNINNFFVENYPWVKFTLANKSLILKDIIWTWADFASKLEELFGLLWQNKFKTFSKENYKVILKYEGLNWEVLCKFCGLNYIEWEEIQDNICKSCYDIKHRYFTI